MPLSYPVVLQFAGMLLATALAAVVIASTRVIREDESGLVIRRYGRPLPS